MPPAGDADTLVAVTFPEPTLPARDTTEVLLRYLDHFRSVVLERVDGLSEPDLRTSRLPSGWSPLELVRHLTFVERRWLEWGFEGRPVADPWGDARDGRWYVGGDEPVPSVTDALRARGLRTREIAQAHALTDVGQPGERWDGAEPATLERVLLHLLQEYARHAGHLDVVRELIDGRTGEST